jgi:hypothetical protein
VSGWVWLISDVNGMPHRVPDNPSVITFWTGRGYEATDIPGDLDSDSEEFVAAFDEWAAASEPAKPVEEEVAVLEVPDEAESATNKKEEK